MDGNNKGFGSWGQVLDHQGGPFGEGGGQWQGPFGEHGGQWQGYENRGPMMNVAGPGPGFNFSQGYGMPPNLPPIPDRPSFYPEFEFSDGRNPGFDRNEGWHGERGNPFWDRPSMPHQGFPRSFKRRNTRGMDDHFPKKKRIFTPVQPAPVKSEKRSYDVTNMLNRQSQPSTVQVKNTKQQNGNVKEVKDEQTKQPNKNKQTRNEESTTKVTPGQLDPTEEQSVSYTPSTTFTCKLCKFETPDETEILKHFVSNQHMEVIRHLYIFLPRRIVDFIQDYLAYEKSKVFQERKRQNLQPEKDSFNGIGQEHFFHRVEAAHCLACDTLIPNFPELLIEHTKSENHTQKCKTSFKEIKSNCLAVAKEMLQDKYTLELLKVYDKGQNPFKEAEWATVHLASNNEVLVAEEDEDVADANGDKNADGTFNKEDSTPDDEDSSLNVLPPSAPEVMETKHPNNEEVLITLDTDGTVHDEEAAEAP